MTAQIHVFVSPDHPGPSRGGGLFHFAGSLMIDLSVYFILGDCEASVPSSSCQEEEGY